MKKLVFILFLIVLIFPLYAQKEFWGIPFGTSQEEAKKIILSKGGKINPESTKETILINDAKFAGREYYFLGINFIDDKCYKGSVFFRPENANGIVDLYVSIKSDVQKKYGPPSLDVEKFKYPYKKGDDDELFAIRSGYADIASFWFFDKELKIIPTSGSEGYVIFISINNSDSSDLIVSLSIHDILLAKIVNERKAQENSKDF